MTKIHVDNSILHWLQTVLQTEDVVAIVEEGNTYESFPDGQAGKDHFRSVVTYAYDNGEWPIDLNDDDAERLHSVLLLLEDSNTGIAAAKKLYIAVICIESAGRSRFLFEDLPYKFRTLIEPAIQIGNADVSFKICLFLNTYSRRQPTVGPFCDIAILAILLDAGQRVLGKLDTPWHYEVDLNWRHGRNCLSDPIRILKQSANAIPQMIERFIAKDKQFSDT